MARAKKRSKNYGRSKRSYSLKLTEEEKQEFPIELLLIAGDAAGIEDQIEGTEEYYWTRTALKKAKILIDRIIKHSLDLE